MKQENWPFPGSLISQECPEHGQQADGLPRGFRGSFGNEGPGGRQEPHTWTSTHHTCQGDHLGLGSLTGVQCPRCELRAQVTQGSPLGGPYAS